MRADNALALATKLQAANQPYKLIIYDDGSHGLRQYHHEAQQEVVNRFRKYLSPPRINN